MNMSNKILMKFFAKIGKNWRVVKKLKVWGTAQNLAQFITAMEYLYKFKKQDGYGNVTLTFKDETATLIYTDKGVRYKEFYMYIAD